MGAALLVRVKFLAASGLLLWTSQSGTRTQKRSTALVGHYRLAFVGGLPVPARTRADLSDACWVETLSGSIAFRTDGTYREVTHWRGGCDDAGHQRPMTGRGTTYVDEGRYTLKPDSLRLYSRVAKGWQQSTSGLVRGDTVFSGYDEDQTEMTYLRERRPSP